MKVPQKKLIPEPEKNALGELTSLLVVATAQAALVSHKKEAVQFWYIRKRGFLDYTDSKRNTRD